MRKFCCVAQNTILPDFIQSVYIRYHFLHRRTIVTALRQMSDLLHTYNVQPLFKWHRQNVVRHSMKRSSDVTCKLFPVVWKVKSQSTGKPQLTWQVMYQSRYQSACKPSG